MFHSNKTEPEVKIILLVQINISTVIISSYIIFELNCYLDSLFDFLLDLTCLIDVLYNTPVSFGTDGHWERTN